MPAATSLDDEYTRLVEPFRGELRAHCHRMLGSSADAEEALQEALLRAWRGLPGFEGRSSMRSWLYRISTNACLDAIERRRPVVPINYDAGVDPHDLAVPEPLSPSPAAEVEEHEDLEHALAAAMSLIPLPRAVLIMRTALGFSARETAEALETSVAAVNSALQRARKGLEEAPAAGTGPVAPADPATRAIVERCSQALRQGDVGTVVRLLVAEV